MVALLARDKVAALGLAYLDKILTRELEGSLRRLGPTRDEIDFVQGAGRVLRKQRCQSFGRIRSQEPRVCKCQFSDLFLHRCDHIGIAVAKTRHSRAT